MFFITNNFFSTGHKNIRTCSQKEIDHELFINAVRSMNSKCKALVEGHITLTTVELREDFLKDFSLNMRVIRDILVNIRIFTGEERDLGLRALKLIREGVEKGMASKKDHVYIPISQQKILRKLVLKQCKVLFSLSFKIKR
jgi:hypothetical protein